MVLNLISSDGRVGLLDTTLISYTISLLDQCVEFNIKIKYKNTSTLPISLKFENDDRDLGILFHLESLTEQNSKIHTLFNNTTTISQQVQEFINNNNYSTNIFCKQYDNSGIELLPDKEITLISKYFKEYDFNIANDQYRLKIPKQQPNTTTTNINVDILIECQFSNSIKSISCESHPTSVAGSFLIENGTSKSMFHLNSNTVQNEDFIVLIQFNTGSNSQDPDEFYGWCSGVSLNDSTSPSLSPTAGGGDRQQLNSSQSQSPPFIYSSIININSNNLQQDESLQVQWNDPVKTTVTYHKPAISKGSFVSHLFESDQFISLVNSNSSLNTSNSIPTTTTSANNNNVILKYNKSIEFNLQLKKTKLSSLLNRYISLYRLKKYYLDLSNNNNNNNNNNNAFAEDIPNLSLLLKLFFNIQYEELLSQQQKSSSPLSQSAPDLNKNLPSKTTTPTVTNSTTDSSGGLKGESLSSFNFQKNKIPGLQSYTAPPSIMNKDMSNPIADFIAANKAGLGTSTTPKTKKGPPPKLGGPPITGGTSDIRLQRLASYTKVNQMWNLSLSDLAERHTISMRELEPFALDCALAHIRNHWWKPNRLATIHEIRLLRTIVSGIIHTNKIEITFVDTKVQPPKSKESTSPNSSTPALQNLSGGFSDLSKLLLPPTATVTPSQSESALGETIIKEVDPTKLKWIIENVLDSERLQFQAIDNIASNPQKEPWFSVSVYETKGNRPHMEDKHVIIEYPNEFYGKSSTNNTATEPKEQIFFGVFDGHNGKIAAEFSKINLPYEVFSVASGFSSGEKNIDKIQESLKQGYNETDKYFLQMAEREDKKAGTTVATVILERDVFYVGNVGDTEVVISQNGIARALSTLHNPKNPSEKERVENAGGSIICYGTLRVNGILSVTRSIGDKNLKEYISSDPSFLEHRISKEDQFIIMASDGLWDVFTYQEVVDYIISGKFNNNNNSFNNNNDNISSVDDSGIGLSSSSSSINNSNNDCNNNNNNVSGGSVETTKSTSTSISEQIVEEAIRRNSKDNITLVIIFLRDNYSPLSNTATNTTTTTTN